MIFILFLIGCEIMNVVFIMMNYVIGSYWKKSMPLA